MKLFYDYQCFSQRSGGISRYFYEVISRVRNYPDTCVEVPLFFSNNMYLDHKRKFLPRRHFKGKTWITDRINGAYSRHYLSRAAGTFDLFHPTYYTPYFLDLIGNKPFVITVHDMTHELFPQLFRNPGKTTDEKRRVTSAAAKIIAVSANTKRDLVRHFDIPEEKIEVVYHGNALRYTEELAVPYAKYLLFVGDRGVYKNFAPMLRTIAPIMKSRGLEMVCVGGRGFSSVEIGFLSELGLVDRVHQVEGVSDPLLAAYYHHAVALVYPSRYEGFGMPVLEAFACGCPVVTSSAASLPEVGGEAAVYFDATNETSLFAAVEQVTGDDRLREALREKGYVQETKFSWDIAAEKTYAVYGSVV